MKGYDPEGEKGPRFPLPDYVEIKEPLADKIVSEPSSEQREAVVMPVSVGPEETYNNQPEQGYQPETYTEQPVF